MIAILTLIFVVAISFLITKTGTIALMQTGMSRERAQFQARSAFSGAGFTTSESEVVVKHPIRRRIIMNLIVCGNAGVVTAIATLIIGFAGKEETSLWLKLSLLVLGFVTFYFVTRSKRLDRWLERSIKKLLERYAGLRARSFARIVTVMEDHEVTEMEVSENLWLQDGTLAELKLPAEGVLVLGVIRGDESFVGVPPGAYRVQETDRLVLFGKTEQIADLAKRKDRLKGKQDHQESVERHLEEVENIKKELDV